ncbi:hypothetical protein BVY02_00330 [bacterium J17]|nr:hypothetical protein BVY02_00330 [bacterium J17]
MDTESVVVIQCPACETKFSVEAEQLAKVDNPRFHCSRCGHYFDFDKELASSPIENDHSDEQINEAKQMWTQDTTLDEFEVADQGTEEFQDDANQRTPHQEHQQPEYRKSFEEDFSQEVQHYSNIENSAEDETFADVPNQDQDQILEEAEQAVAAEFLERDIFAQESEQIISQTEEEPEEVHPGVPWDTPAPNDVLDAPPAREGTQSTADDAIDEHSSNYAPDFSEHLASMMTEDSEAKQLDLIPETDSSPPKATSTKGGGRLKKTMHIDRTELTYKEIDGEEVPIITADWPDQPDDREHEADLGSLIGRPSPALFPPTSKQTESEEGSTSNATDDGEGEEKDDSWETESDSTESSFDSQAFGMPPIIDDSDDTSDERFEEEEPSTRPDPFLDDDYQADGEDTFSHLEAELEDLSEDEEDDLSASTSRPGESAAHISREQYKSTTQSEPKVETPAISRKPPPSGGESHKPSARHSANNSFAPLFVFWSVPLLLCVGFWLWKENIESTPGLLKGLFNLEGSNLPHIAPRDLSLIDIRSEIVTLDNGRRVLEVSGNILNGSQKTLNDVRIEAKIYNRENKELQKVIVYSNNGLADASISSLKEDALKKLQDAIGIKRTLKPNSNMPFRVVFFEPFSDAAWYSARVYSVKS